MEKKEEKTTPNWDKIRRYSASTLLSIAVVWLNGRITTLEQSNKECNDRIYNELINTHGNETDSKTENKQLIWISQRKEE